LVYFAYIWLPWQRSLLPEKFANLENPIVHAKSVSISYRELKYVQFWHIFVLFSCHGNALCSLIIRIVSILDQLSDPENPTILFSQEEFLDFLHRTEISAILADFCLNLVAIATPFNLLKIPIVYLNSPIRHSRKQLQYFT